MNISSPPASLIYGAFPTLDALEVIPEKVQDTTKKVPCLAPMAP